MIFLVKINDNWDIDKSHLRNKTKLIEALEQKHRQPEVINQPTIKHTPDLEPKTSEKVDQVPSAKEEFKNILSEVRKQTQVRENKAKQSVKIKDNDWDFDR